VGEKVSKDLQQICHNNRQGGKVIYRTAAAAEKIRRRSSVKLFVYHCPFGDHFHLTSKEQRDRVEQPPSLGTLRRWLENQSKVIAAQQRRLDAAEVKLAEEKKRAEERQRKAQQEHDEELAAINALVGRLKRV